MIKYKIITGSADGCIGQVNKRLSEGWKCQGGFFVGTMGQCSQAMIYIKRWWQFWRK